LSLQIIQPFLKNIFADVFAFDLKLKRILFYLKKRKTKKKTEYIDSIHALYKSIKEKKEIYLLPICFSLSHTYTPHKHTTQAHHTSTP